MRVYGQLQNAQLDNKTSDYSSGVIGRAWWNSTVGKVQVDDGSNIRALIRNDSKVIFGNSGTGAYNIRLNRSGNGVLQFLTGDDVSAEGVVSNSLNQIGFRAENYTNATMPVNANSGRIIYVTDLGVLAVDSGAGWTSIGTGTSPFRVAALYTAIVGSAAQVASGAATHSTIASAIASLVDGNNLLILLGTTHTENITLSKVINIEGQGHSSIIDGTFTFAAGASKAMLRNIQVTGNVTINSGVTGVQFIDFWINSGKTVTDNGTASFIQGIQE